MQITLILICAVAISVVQGTSLPRISKPKLHIEHNFHSSEVIKPKSPEERRKLSLFPKSYMKYVISSEPIFEIATHKPMVHGTKKPLMKKLHELDKKNKGVETDTKQAIIETKNINDNDLYAIPNAGPVKNIEELGKEIIKDNTGKTVEKQNDRYEEKNIAQTNSNEHQTPADVTANKDSNLKNIIFPPKTNPIEVNVRNKSEEHMPVVSDTFKISEETDAPDWMEFIFVNPVNKSIESDKFSSEEPEEYVTTEFYEEPKPLRQKRGSNVIEEENLASTVAGYKYTYRDERLNNDLAFKNIHS